MSALYHVVLPVWNLDDGIRQVFASPQALPRIFSEDEIIWGSPEVPSILAVVDDAFIDGLRRIQEAGETTTRVDAVCTADIGLRVVVIRGGIGAADLFTRRVQKCCLRPDTGLARGCGVGIMIPCPVMTRWADRASCVRLVRARRAV